MNTPVCLKQYYNCDLYISLQLSDADDPSRYEVPRHVVNINFDQHVDIRKFGRSPSYSVEVSEQSPFSFKVIRKTTGTIM